MVNNEFNKIYWSDNSLKKFNLTSPISTLGSGLPLGGPVYNGLQVSLETISVNINELDVMRAEIETALNDVDELINFFPDLNDSKFKIVKI